MEKLKIILKLAYKFCVRYTKEYIVALIKPVLAAILAFLIIGVTMINKNLALLGLLSLPLVFYSFWRIYLITYALNFAAMNFFNKNASTTFQTCIEITKSKGNELALWVSFCAFLNLVLILPSVIYMFYTIFNSSIGFINPIAIGSSFVFVIFNAILIIPFTTYLNQAFYFKKESEGYWSLFLNCYRKLDLIGILLIIIFIAAQSFISTAASYFGPIAVLVLNPFVTGASAYWFYGRLQQK